MKGLLLAAAMTLGLAAPAAAQDVTEGVYDGSVILGWAYSSQASDAIGLPTWYPTSGDPSADGANCNIGSAPDQRSAEEYTAHFGATNPTAFAGELAASGLGVTDVYLTESIEVDGHPALRSLLTARTEEEGDPSDFMIVYIGGADQAVIITCSVRQGMILGRLQAFYAFVNGVGILTEPPQ